MFGVLAVFGDAGGAGGPWITGAVAEVASGTEGLLHDLARILPADDGSGLRVGLLVGTAFPLTLVVAGLLYAVLGRRADRPGVVGREPVAVEES